jgi:transposase
MLQRREQTQDWISQQVYRILPLSDELQRIKALFPDDTIMEAARPFYSNDMGRKSEDPVLQTKVLFLSFFYDVKGDSKTLETVKYRLDWRQFCDLRVDEAMFDRTTLVKFRRQVGLAVIEATFQALLDDLVKQGLLDLRHRFFDGTPVKARASINPYRDEIYTETFAAIQEKLQQFHAQQIALDPTLNPSPVELTKTHYSSDNSAVDARWTQEMKPVGERQSAGDPEARFQRGKHGKRSELGYEVFFSTDSAQLFIEDVLVSEEASQGQSLFQEKVAHSEPGQQWSVDAEFRTGDLLHAAEEAGVILNTPAQKGDAEGKKFPKAEFLYDADADTYACPAQQTLSHCGTNQKTGERHYRADRGVCDACPYREDCTTSKTGRTVTRNRFEAEWERQREHARTPEAVMGKVLRGIVAEGKFAEAVRHGLKTMRYVGRDMAVLQSTLVAYILNVKRLLRVEAQPSVPATQPVG